MVLIPHSLQHIFCVSFRVITHMAQLSFDLEGLCWKMEYGNGPGKGMIYLGYFEQC